MAIPPTSAVEVSPTSSSVVLSHSDTQSPNELTSHGLPPGSHSVHSATVIRQTRELTPPSDSTLTASQHPSTTGTPPGTPSTMPPGSPAVIGIVLAPILVILTAVVVVSVAVVMKHSHSKRTAGELHETSDAIGMKENEAYGTNTQTQRIATAANEAYGCVEDISVVQNVAYVPAAVNIPTVQNEAYGMESRDNTGDGEYAYVATGM